MSFEDKIDTPERGSELIPDLKRDLWYESENGIITREIIRRVLIDHLSKNLSVAQKLTGFKEKTGHNVIFSKLDLAVSLILGKIDWKELRKLHTQIRKATTDASDELKERQIAMLTDAIRACLSVGEEKTNEEVHSVIRGLLNQDATKL